jgi:DNA invertase Pin-like site-specific DNA recombinase
MTTRAKLALLYARVSTTEQAERGYSLAQQIEALREWCEREGYKSSRRSQIPDRAVLPCRGRGWTV